MLLRLYKQFYSWQDLKAPGLRNRSQHVRVGFTPVGLSWTSFSSLLTAFIHGLSQNLGRRLPLQMRSSDLLLASNEPPRWLLGKRNKKAVCPVASFPTTKGCLALLTYPWCTAISRLLSSSRPVLEFYKQQPFCLTQTQPYSAVLSFPVISLSVFHPLSLFLTRTPPGLSAFVPLFGRALA